MSINPFQEKGTPLEKQYRSWKQAIQAPYRKQEVDAYTRCRVIVMNGIEIEASIFSHNFARNTADKELLKTLATIRGVEHQQQNTINWLNPADQTVLETTIGYEQVAVDLTAFLSRSEPDPYVKEVFDFGLLEDFDHLYRYSQMLDLVEGKDPTEITQGKTEILPGRPTQDHHNDPILRLREHYAKNKAHPISKANILTLVAGEQQTWNFYKNVGNMYGSPELRELYAEISSVEEEHVTQYESLMDPTETWLEKWVLHEFTECADYFACYSTEVDPRIKQIWEMFLNFELEHLRIAGEMLKKYQGIEPQQIVGDTLPTPTTFEENKEYVRKVLFETVDRRLMPDGKFARISELPQDWPSYAYQNIYNANGSPSETVVTLRMNAAGHELVRVDSGKSDAEAIKEAGELRTKTLDASVAPNTAPAGVDTLIPEVANAPQVRLP
jgi:rubrerythrin